MLCENSSYLAVVLASYFIGSIPWAFIIGKAKGIDIRRVGSGNVGATNVSRVLGKKYGVACFILDFLKGAVPVTAVRLLSRSGVFCADPDFLMIASALAAVAGHLWPVFLKFKGGKGVSTSAGAIVALSPLTLVAAGLVWITLFKLFRYVSLASIVSALALPGIGYAMSKYGIERNSTRIICLFIALAAASVIMHRSNIVRLLKGTEHRFEKKKDDSEEKDQTGGGGGQ